jgi:L-alanine-DL-glutamate epimerase-like enolase superfamily enzyme
LAASPGRPAGCAPSKWRSGDLAGKVYNCPVYQMLGGQWRDKVRIYADTTESEDPQEYGRRAKERKAMGITWMKMDLGINVIENTPGMVMQPAGQSKWELREQPHPFMATEVTDKGIDRLCEYVAAVRENIGYDMPLSMDHLGHIGVKSVIKLGKAYEKFNLEWIEDVIPWYYTDLLKEITDASPTPTITGEFPDTPGLGVTLNDDEVQEAPEAWHGILRADTDVGRRAVCQR